ncbi:FecR domain-containing protein [Labrys sp. KNU-23]|uniref:FecR family protein n=1 Tax=Labrys sp. KNU-23 TaxID=2789216 RepID=UPI0011F063CE|nr:FecR domain-containing protein [Labrys sp. KNU-23]QEN86661.1 FecR domain-containing protein [Labrys sp. KNU-23]
MPSSRFLTFSLLGLGVLCAVASMPASAEETVGNTVGVTPAAIGTVAGELGVDIAVFRDETVRTGPSGALEIKFLDQTRLALGSSSSAKLDRFVYSGGQAKDVVIGLSKGVFRFASGVSAKKAYWIQTPLAGIGVRGTNFTAEVSDSYERFTIWEGVIEVCPRQRGLSIDEERRRRCPLLKRRGDTITIFPGSRSRRGGPPVVFSPHCAETGAGAQLCGRYGGEGGKNRGQRRPGFNFPTFNPPQQRG